MSQWGPLDDGVGACSELRTDPPSTLAPSLHPPMFLG